MSEDQFTKLFQYMTQRFDGVNGEFVKVDKRFDNLEKYIDTVIKNQEIDDDERLVIGHQLERLDHWVHGVANKIDYKLTT